MTFITNNLGQIVLSAISVIVGAIVGYIFYRLQKRDVVSAKAERVKRSHEELLDIIESYVINKQIISEDSIYNLLAASEREYQVNLRAICTSVTLLQDVALRLQQSRHLDVTQKAGYVAQIEQIISTIIEMHKETPEEAKQPLEIVATVEAAITNDEKEKALEAIGLLKRGLIKSVVAPRAEDTSTQERWQLIASLIAGVATVIATFIAVGNVLNISKDISIQIVVGLLAVIGMAIITIYIRGIIKRSRN